jgi:phage portal protein BeeE
MANALARAWKWIQEGPTAPAAKAGRHERWGVGGDYPLSAPLMQFTYPMDGKESVGTSFRSYAIDGYGSNGPVFSVMRVRARLFTQADFRYRQDETQRLVNGPGLEILANPWPNGQTTDLLARNLQDADLSGNSFTAKVGEQLVRLRPDFVTIVSEKLVRDGHEFRNCIGYLYSPNGGIIDADSDFYTVDEVAHWAPIPDPMSDFRGMSPLTPVVREINADIAMTLHKRSFFENSATPNLLIKYAQEIDPTVLAKIKAQFNANHAGPQNAWGTAVLDAGGDVTVVGNNFSEMAFTALQSAGETRIASALGVPPILAGMLDGLNSAGYNVYAPAMRAFADGEMRSLWQSWCSAHAKFVDVPDGHVLWYDTRAIAALREGEKDIADAARFWAVAANQLVASGYDPISVTAALVANDFSVLTHTGLVPTALTASTGTAGLGGSV